jgi:peptidoglycan/LPS O-acetylase OafA/YrhL
MVAHIEGRLSEKMPEATLSLDSGLDTSIPGMPDPAPQLQRAHETIRILPGKRIPSLDGLRALSIGAVLLGHGASHFASPLHNHSFGNLSYFGVMVFFVLSGFLITTLLLQEHNKTGKIALKSFYRRRAARILPASLFYTAVILSLGRVSHVSRVQAVYALTFTTSYFFVQAHLLLQHLWSLSVEEQFYALWPLVFASGVRNARRYCWLIMFTAPIVRALLRPFGSPVYSHCAPAIADSIAAGCLLAFYGGTLRDVVRKYFISSAGFSCLAVCTIGIASVLYRLQLVWLWGIVPCMIAITVMAAIERRGAFLNSKPLVWTGLLSYSIYLWQQLFLTTEGPLHYLWLRLALTFGMAYLSYRIIEQPALRWGASRAS